MQNGGRTSRGVGCTGRGRKREDAEGRVENRERERSVVEKGWRVAGESAVPSLREGCEAGMEDGVYGG